MKRPRSILILVVSLFLDSISAFSAPCSPNFTLPQDVKIEGDSVLIVTHPSTQWDGRFASKGGMDASVTFAKAMGMPVIYLQDDEPSNAVSYFFSDCSPNYWVSSDGGEFQFAVPARHVYTVGGHFELCQLETMEDLMGAWSALPPGPLTLTYVMDGIYNYGGYIDDGDAYAEDFRKFIDVLSYANPRDPWVMQKLSLLEMMALIKDPDLQFEYLKRGLPTFYKLPAEYQIEMSVQNGKTEVIRKGEGNEPPVLKIEFIQSVYDDGYIPAFIRGDGLRPAKAKHRG